LHGCLWKLLTKTCSLHYKNHSYIFIGLSNAKRIAETAVLLTENADSYWQGCPWDIFICPIPIP